MSSYSRITGKDGYVPVDLRDTDIYEPGMNYEEYRMAWHVKHARNMMNEEERVSVALGASTQYIMMLEDKFGNLDYIIVAGKPVSKIQVTKQYLEENEEVIVPQALTGKGQIRFYLTEAKKKRYGIINREIVSVDLI